MISIIKQLVFIFIRYSVGDNRTQAKSLNLLSEKANSVTIRLSTTTTLYLLSRYHSIGLILEIGNLLVYSTNFVPFEEEVGIFPTGSNPWTNRPRTLSFCISCTCVVEK
jgi:hypothetical protein